MTADMGEIRPTLNDLTETCKDGSEGFRAAADHVKNPEARALFFNYSRQRAQFADELQAAASRIGGGSPQPDSMAGAIHRGWQGLKSALAGDNDHAILEEAERGEEAAIKSYRTALAQELPSDLHQIVERQLGEIERTRDTVRSLRDKWLKSELPMSGLV